MELTKNISLRRLQWVGHVMRMKDERVLRKALGGYVARRRPVGEVRQRIEVSGGGRLKRPWPKLGCSAIGEEKIIPCFELSIRNITLLCRHSVMSQIVVDFKKPTERM